MRAKLDLGGRRGAPLSLEQCAAIPEERVWLESQHPLVEVALRSWALLDSVDCYSLRLPSPGQSS